MTTDDLERRMTTAEATLSETRTLLDDIATQHREVVETQRAIASDLWGNPARGEVGVKAQVAELREFFVSLQLSLKIVRWIVAFFGAGYVAVLIRWLLESNPLGQ